MAWSEIMEIIGVAIVLGGWIGLSMLIKRHEKKHPYVSKLTKEQVERAKRGISKLDPNYKEPVMRCSLNVDGSRDVRCSINVERKISRNCSKYVQETEEFWEWENSHMEPTFQELLLELIALKGYSNKDFYKAAGIDRKLFSAMKNNVNYRPKKETAVACCFGVKAYKDEAIMLLNAAGYSLSMSIPWDRVIYYCLNEEITELDHVNQLLYEVGEKCIGY